MTFNANAQKDLAREFKIQQWQLSADEVSAYIDTKGLFNRNQRSFSTDRKWVWEKFRTYVAEIIPVKFFAKFGCPQSAFKSKKTNKPRKMFLGMRTIAEKFGLK